MFYERSKRPLLILFLLLGYVDIEDNNKGNIPLYYFENIMGMLLLNVL